VWIRLQWYVVDRKVNPQAPANGAFVDHSSATKAGYPSAFVIESDFKYSDRKIHTTEDKLEYLNFNHMLQHARLTLGLVYELAFAKFD
jgi:leucyl aminopeptidase